VVSGRGVLVGGLGFAVGAAAVAGGFHAFPDADPRPAVAVDPGFCERTLAGAAGRWDLTLQPQETVTGDRDELTACAAASTSGDVRLTLTVLALTEERGRATDERTSTMLGLACTALQPDGSGERCDGPVEAVDQQVGNASAFVTSDGRAVVTIVFTAPPDRAVGTARDVAALTETLSAGVG
jgi:hypothetical protein